MMSAQHVRPLRIAFVTREFGDSRRGGGIATYVSEMASSLAMRGHNVTVFTASDDTRVFQDSIEEGIRVIRLSGGDFVVPGIEKGLQLLKKLRVFTRFFSYRFALASRVKHEHKSTPFDIIEVPEYGAESLFFPTTFPVSVRLHTSSLVDRETGERTQLALKTVYPVCLGYAEKLITKRASALTSCSVALRNWTALYFNMDSAKIEVVYNPLRRDLWNTVSRAPSSLENNSIIFVGTVRTSKGVGDLLHACDALVSEGREISLSLFGKLGSEGQAFRRKWASTSWCRFHGHIEKKALRVAYLNHSIAVFPSHWEAMGLVCAEAMLCGCLVIGSSGGGMAEIIEDGVSGFLVPPRDTTALRDAILKVMNLSMSERNIISAAAIRRAQTMFGDEYISIQMERFYRNAIGQLRR